MLKTETSFKKSIKWQQPAAVILIMMAVMVIFSLYIFSTMEMVYAWIFGLLVGFVMQKSHICFTAALRDPVFFGMTQLTWALIL